MQKQLEQMQAMFDQLFAGQASPKKSVEILPRKSVRISVKKSVEKSVEKSVRKSVDNA